MEAVTYSRAHQLVPGRVEFHLINPVAESVVRVQNRRIGVGLSRQFPRLGRARFLSERREAANIAVERRESFINHRINGDHVEIGQRWGLVDYLVSRCHLMSIGIHVLNISQRCRMTKESYPQVLMGQSALFGK